MIPTATAEDQAAALHADLTARGYRDIAAAGSIKTGSRVHHAGQQYPEARDNGTATVLAVLEKSPSAWSGTYRRPDIEIIVESDKPFMPGMPTVSNWADYHTRPAARDGE